MSLSKQLMLLISVIFLAIFSINFYTSISNIKTYLEVESEVHAQDTATSLGLSLSPHILNTDDPILETMVNTIFDRGYFLEILLTDMEGIELVRKTNPQTFSEVPSWFVEWLPMKTGTAYSEIDSGWMIGGRVDVTINPGFGYLKLWSQVKESFSYSLMLFLISLGTLALVIRMLLAPLHRIRRLAERIGEGKYETIDPLPWTSEIRSVASSMNMMSGKIERVISALNDRLTEASNRMHLDELTGLENKVSFETNMKEQFIGNKQGYLFLIRIDRLGDFASKNSVAQVDGFIRAFSNTIQTLVAQEKNRQDRLFRIIGSEFILVAENRDLASAKDLCSRICKAFSDLGETYKLDEVGHIGGVEFDPRSTTASLLAAATEAYEKSKIIGPNEYAISEASSGARSVEDWNHLVCDVISNETFDIKYSNQTYALDPTQSEKLLLEEALTDVRDEDNNPVPIGTFISIAESAGLMTELDLKVVRNVIDRIRIEKPSHAIAVNLSLNSIKSNSFRQALFALIEQHKETANRLVFSLSAYAASQDKETFISFIAFTHRAGGRVMLKRFESRQFEIDKLGASKLDYIRLARHYTEEIEQSNEKQNVVATIHELGTLVNIEIHAEGVASDESLKCLRQIGLYGASR